MLKLLNKIVLRMRSFLFTYTPLNFYCISHFSESKVQPQCPLNIRQGGLEDIELMVEMLEYIDGVVAREREKHLFDNGGKAFLAFSESNLAHIAWLFYSPGIQEADHLVKIKQDEGYISSCDTRSQFRGKSIYPVVLQHIVKHAFAENKKKCYISCAPANSASIKGIEKAGFSFAGTKHKFRLFGINFNNCWSSSTVYCD
jgi:hypothetical protein